MSPKGPEVRIGLVLYGGVSLAVYIYGVVLEVQRLLREAASLERGGDPEQASAYARALSAAGVSSVTVDILSGTSAGGINGILLAKALARGTDVDLARRLWLKGGDIEQLLQPPSARDPNSLLQSGYFEARLREGMELLGSEPAGERPAPTPILDLFVSSTNLRGGQRLFADSLGREIATRQYRYVFQLKLRHEQSAHGGEQGYEQDDFEAKDDERLVKLARATSAFPGAFEPVLLAQADGVLAAGDADAWFGDGGILNNKPFSEAIETIFSRSSDRPVRRWLFSVDPDPVPAVAEDGGAGAEPAFDQVVVRSIATIPRYQSIVRDLAALQTHNEKVAAAEQVILEGEAEIAAAAGPEGERGEGVAAGPLGAGPAAAYRVVRRQAWEREVADHMVSALAPDGGEVDRAGVHRAFRRGAGESTEDLGAVGLDLALQRRRIYYLIKLLSMAVEVESGAADEAREALWAEFETISAVLWDSFAASPVPVSGGEERASAVEQARSRIFTSAAQLASTAARSEARLSELLAGVVVILPGPSSGSAGDPFAVALEGVFADFERRDAMLLAADVYGDLGQRDRVEHAQVSSAAATNTGVEPAHKLAGVTLGHFGGFLDEGWRQNDLMWGRLDGAEVLMRAILAEREEEAPALLDEVQEEVLAAELPEMLSGPEPWKAKLQAHAGAGPKPGDLGGRKLMSLGLRAAAILRKMLATAAQGAAEGGLGNRIRAFALRAVANAIGFLLALIYLPATAFFAKGKLVRRAATLAALLPFLWGLATMALGVLGVLPLGSVAGPAALGIAIYPLFLLVYWVLGLAARRLKSPA